MPTNNHPRRDRPARFYVWQVLCTDDRGWGAEPDGLWYPGYRDPAARLFLSRDAAREAFRLIRGDRTVWTTRDDDGEETYDPPRFGLRRVPIYVFAEDDRMREAVEALRGAPLTDIATAPLAVLRDTAAFFRGSETAWRREANSWSPHTNTSAHVSASFVAGMAHASLAAIEALIAEREAT